MSAAPPTVKLLLDMNLPPEWSARLAQGIPGRALVDNRRSHRQRPRVLTWATDHGFVVLTHDLDFAAILAATSDRAPSVVQVRIHDVLAETSFEVLTAALDAHDEQLA